MRTTGPGNGRGGQRRFGRIIVWLTLVLLLLGTVAWGIGMASLPKTSGTLGVAALSAPVTVARDSHGIPTITARNSHDAYAALGFVHAQDRFFQMEMMRRLGRGRMAETSGSVALRTDKFMRTLGLVALAEDSLTRLHADTRAALDAYAAGVNAWLEGQGLLPPEFLVLGIEPEPWTPVDSLLWGRMMALRLSDNWHEEALRAAMLGTLPPGMVADLWQEAPVPEERAAADGLGAPLAALSQVWPEEIAPTSASNQWVIGGARTARGAPILANDPHLPLRTPNVWYLADVRTPDWHLTGATVPGTPFHLVGQNDDLAWGFTTTHSDTADLFVETLVGADRYATPQGPRPLEVREENIAIRDGTTVTLAVRATRHGPVISDLLPLSTPPGTIIALQATALARDDRTADALLRLNRAGSVPEALEAFAVWHAPQQNVVLADRDNRIAFAMVGRTPVRKAGIGTMPRPGAEGKYDWIGWLAPDTLPRRLAGGMGALVNANERPAPADYPYFLGAHWPPDYRARRIRERLDGLQDASVGSTADIQLDAVSVMARRTLPLLRAAVTPRDAGAQAALALLDGWDHSLSRQRPEALLFNSWLLETQERIFRDEMGPLLYWQWGRYPRPRPLIRVFEGRSDVDWCDDVTTPQAETCADHADAAFHEVVGDLSAAYGQDPTTWTWGEAHKARFSHPILRHIPLVKSLTATEVATDGGLETINRGTYAGNKPGMSWADRFSHVHGAGLRAVMDLGAREASGFMIAMGQSGHPLSPHYSDLLLPWRNGKLVRFGAPAVATLTLTPAASGPR